MVVMDSNIIIDYLRQLDKSDVEFLKILESGEEVGVSILTVQELFAGKSTRDEEKMRQVLGLLGGLRILDYTFEVARKAGELVRERVSDLRFADAAIAATVIMNGARLATLNEKDFEGIEGVILC
jgi:tRNA(fMet)-specific endonuclease VapC